MQTGLFLSLFFLFFMNPAHIFSTFQWETFNFHLLYCEIQVLNLYLYLHQLLTSNTVGAKQMCVFVSVAVFLCVNADAWAAHGRATLCQSGLMKM